MPQPNRLSGTKDVEINLTPDNSVVIITRYHSAYEAAIAYEEIATAAKKGVLALKFTLGAVLQEE